MCDRCEDQRQRHLKLERCIRVQQQLTELGINPHDLVELIAFLMPEEFSNQVARQARYAAIEQTTAFLSTPDVKKTISGWLFEDMVDIAIGVQNGANKHGRKRAGKSSTTSSGKKASGGKPNESVSLYEGG